MATKKKLVRQATEQNDGAELLGVEMLIAETERLVNSQCMADRLREPIRRMLAAMSTGSNDVSPLQAAVIMKKIQKISEAAFTSNVMEANASFKLLNGMDAPIIVLGSVVSKYTKPTKWAYSSAVIEAEAKLKAMKEVEQKTGVARDVSEPINENSSPLFIVKGA